MAAVRRTCSRSCGAGAWPGPHRGNHCWTEQVGGGAVTGGSDGGGYWMWGFRVWGVEG